MDVAEFWELLDALELFMKHVTFTDKKLAPRWRNGGRYDQLT